MSMVQSDAVSFVNVNVYISQSPSFPHWYIFYNSQMYLNLTQNNTASFEEVELC